MKIWILCYILRFPGEIGSWGQCSPKGFLTEKDAYDAKCSMSDPSLYSMDSVEVPEIKIPSTPLTLDSETKLYRYVTHEDVVRWEQMELKYNNLKMEIAKLSEKYDAI